MPKASKLDALMHPDTFFWSTGIEDTFIVEPSKLTGRTLDEYELTGHYTRWREDIDLMASLGVACARYGIPWYRIQPSPDRWDWTWPDQTLDLMLEKGVEPIVDLVHYGVPAWLDGALLSEDFPSRMADYSARVAERYKVRIHWYTPLNEPRINAWYAGMLGWWPPHKRGWKSFSRILLNIARAICLSHRALKDVDSEVVCLHVDPADLYYTKDPALHDEVNFRQRIVHLALDLITGRVDANHDLWTTLIQWGHSEERVEHFQAIKVQPDVIGVNCYPLFGQKEVLNSGNRIVMRNRYADGKLLETLVEKYWRTYERPLMITETASLGTKRGPWMNQSVAAIKNLRETGVPVVGYTWWPMFSIASWGYQHGNKELDHYMVHLGLWDLDSNLNRMETPVAQAYRQLVGLGSAPVGELKMGRKEVKDFALR